MKLHCKICGVHLGDITEGKVATKKLVCLCNRCYKVVSIGFQPKTESRTEEKTKDYDILNELLKATGALK